jgi:hypothetical protein
MCWSIIGFYGRPACGRVRDLVVGMGRPDNGTGGYTVVIHHDNGYTTQYLHLSRFVVPDGTRVAMGDVATPAGSHSPSRRWWHRR